ncbi:zinc-dependent metalloprotease [Leifsonia sp. NPDC056824]|uniref:zinc-dependent metalloprotease n=1 Tax=Leifsonia sp. NPDC056824 TaxID=3345953 RepID=UPI0036AB9655
MADDPNKEPDDEFRDMLREFLSGDSSIDPSQLAGAAGLPNDPAAIQQLLGQLQNALMNPGGGINWELADQQARTLASEGAHAVTPAERSTLDQAFHVAALWLDEATTVAGLSTPPELIGRAEWARQTMPLWTQLAEPVALSISDALTRVLTEQAPEEMQGMIQNAGQVMRSVGGALFAMQLGQVVGQLAKEVVSGGDIGIPLLADGTAALIPQNVAEFGDGLDIPTDQVQLYLAVRELAHARLFRHAKWLRLQLITQITAFARGITIDTDRLESLAESFDPSNPEELREAMVSGALIPPKSEEQQEALGRLETVLALVEGWVDVVTAGATRLLPKADAIAETVRRRRAAGGPAESAFATLVGLELRPRRLRDAAALWQAVTDAVGQEARDRLWSHPDLFPQASDLDDPSRLVARLTAAATGQEPERDELDQAIEDLLRGDGDRPTED